MSLEDLESLRLSVHEVARLCELTQNPLPTSIVTLLPQGVSDEARQVTAVVAERGLLARGILTASGAEAVLDEAILALVQLLSAPGLVVRVDTEDELLSQQTIYATPSAAVLEVHDGHGVLNYTPMDPADVVPFIVTTTRLDDRPVGSPGSDFAVTVGALTRAGEALANGDTSGASTALVTAGAPQTQADGYVDAIASQRQASYGVSSLCKVDDQMKASVVAWLDCGSAGYWLVDQPDALDVYAPRPQRPSLLDESVLDSPVRIASVSGQDLLAQVVAGLPWG